MPIQAQNDDLNDYFKEVLSEMGYGPEQLKDMSMRDRVELVRGLHQIQRSWDKDLPIADQDESKRSQIYDHYQSIIQQHFRQFKIEPQGENLRQVGKPLQISQNKEQPSAQIQKPQPVQIPVQTPEVSQPETLTVPKTLASEGPTPWYDEWAKKARENPPQLVLPDNSPLDPRIEALKRLKK